jgi:hypothetical protein
MTELIAGIGQHVGQHLRFCLVRASTTLCLDFGGRRALRRDLDPQRIAQQLAREFARSPPAWWPRTAPSACAGCVALAMRFTSLMKPMSSMRSASSSTSQVVSTG